jgi:Tfp pilus assembly PilM family ATPase
MRAARKSTMSPIGLVHDASEFRAVQLSRSKDGERVVASAVFPRLEQNSSSKNPDAHELRWVASMLARRGFVGNQVSVLPHKDSYSTHIVELPPIDDPDAKRQVARGEVAREKKCAPIDFEIGYWDLPFKGRNHESMVVACDRSSIDAKLDCIENAGMAPVALEVPEIAVARLVECEEDNMGIVGVLHIGWSDSIAVISNEQTIVYARRIKHGIKEIHERLVEHYRFNSQAAASIIDRMQTGTLEDHERSLQGLWSALVRVLVDDLDIAIRYVSHAYRAAELRSIFVSGYGASHPDLHSEIDAVLGMDVEPLVNSVFQDSTLTAAECAKLAVPAGLAMRFD